MELQINTLGNGACPLCRFDGKCKLQATLREALKDKSDSSGEGMEIVIYTCPVFKENA